MINEIRTDLVKISTYAKKMNKSTTWVYDQAKTKNITIVEIDGVKFVKIEKR